MHVLVRLTPFTCHRLCVNLPCNLSALISASTHNEKPQHQSPLYTYIYRYIYMYIITSPSAPLCLHLLVCAPLPLPASAHTFTFYTCMMSKCLSALQAISRCLTAIRQEAEPPSPPSLLLIFLPHPPEERQLLSENQFLLCSPQQRTASSTPAFSSLGGLCCNPHLPISLGEDACVRWLLLITGQDLQGFGGDRKLPFFPSKPHEPSLRFSISVAYSLSLTV